MPKIDQVTSIFIGIWNKNRKTIPEKAKATPAPTNPADKEIIVFSIELPPLIGYRHLKRGISVPLAPMTTGPKPPPFNKRSSLYRQSKVSIDDPSLPLYKQTEKGTPSSSDIEERTQGNAPSS